MGADQLQLRISHCHKIDLKIGTLYLELLIGAESNQRTKFKVQRTKFKVTKFKVLRSMFQVANFERLYRIRQFKSKNTRIEIELTFE
jgi:hypothetical protein